jgi:hypothetical protein
VLERRFGLLGVAWEIEGLGSRFVKCGRKADFLSNAIQKTVFGWPFGVARIQRSTRRTTDSDLPRSRSAPP